MSLLYIDKVKENKQAFAEKVEDISSRLGIDPNWLMWVMFKESGLDHRIENKSYPFSGQYPGYATGLIQFTPETAIKTLGTTVAKLKNMTNVEQLDYVYKYLSSFANKMKSFIDVYFVVFFPIAVGKPDDWVFQAKNISASKVAKNNPVFDLNKDGQLTVAEVRNAMLKTVPLAWAETFKKKVQE